MKSFSNRNRSCTAILSAALLAAFSGLGHAALTYTVTLDVTALVGNANGPFALDVQMTRGSGNVSNSVTISNIQVGDGSFTGSPVTGGGVSGSFATALTLDNSASNSYFAQEFTAGTTTIRFDVTQTTLSEYVGTGTAIPDQFNLFIDDNNTADGYVPTNDPSGGNSLLTSTISSGETLQDIRTFISVAPDAGVSVSLVAPVPEPSSVLLLGLGGLGLFARRRRG